MMTLKPSKELHASRKTISETQEGCPHCGAGRVEPPPTAIELVGNIACLVLVAAMVSFGFYVSSKIVDFRFDHFPIRLLSPDRMDPWD